MDDHGDTSIQANSDAPMSAHLADDLLSTTPGGWKSFYN